MPDDLTKNAIQWFKKASDTASEKAVELKNEYDNSELKKNVDGALKETKDFLDEKGITDKASEVSSYTTDQLDKVSGKKILDLVEERLSLQDDYNNILAGKLDEALERINTIEKQLKEK